MHYIRDVCEKKETVHSHNKFIRYSKGEFTGAALNIKVSKANVKVNGSFHLSDELLYLIADYLGSRDVKVKGTLGWNRDLSPELEENGIKHLKVVKSRGIFNYKIDNVVNLKNFMDKLGGYNILLSLKEDDVKLTSKPKFPKPNKEVSKDFCKAIFPAELKDLILKEFAFDVKDLAKVKEVDIEHKIIIDDIKFPAEDGKMSFEEIRRLAKRCGTLERTISVNKGEPVITKIPICV